MAQLPLHLLTYRHTVVDCSNRPQLCKGGQQSQAEQLQALLPPGVLVVKALNSLSAHQLESGDHGGRLDLAMASNSPGAKRVVASCVERMGFRAVDMGDLQVARQVGSDSGELLVLTLYS